MGAYSAPLLHLLTEWQYCNRTEVFFNGFFFKKTLHFFSFQLGNLNFLSGNFLGFKNGSAPRPLLLCLQG